MSKNPLSYEGNADIVSKSPSPAIGNYGGDSRNFGRQGSVIDGLPSIKDYDTFGTKRSVDSTKPNYIDYLAEMRKQKP